MAGYASRGQGTGNLDLPDSQPRDENVDDASKKRSRRVTLMGFLWRFGKSQSGWSNGSANNNNLSCVRTHHSSVQAIESPSPQLPRKLGCAVA